MIKKLILIITFLATQAAFANPDKYLPMNPEDNDQEARLRGFIRIGMTCEFHKRGAPQYVRRTSQDKSDSARSSLVLSSPGLSRSSLSVDYVPSGSTSPKKKKLSPRELIKRLSGSNLETKE